MNKRKYFLVIILLITFICGCGKKTVTTTKNELSRKEEVIEENVSNDESNSEQNKLVENENNNQSTNDTNTKPNINTSEKTNIENNNINNNITNQSKEEDSNNKEEVKVEENIITTRKIVCTMNQSNENKGFNAIITATATFEDNDMIYLQCIGKRNMMRNIVHMTMI